MYEKLRSGCMQYFLYVPAVLLLLTKSFSFLFFVYVQPLICMSTFLALINFGFHGFLEMDREGKSIEVVNSTCIIDGEDDSFGATLEPRRHARPRPTRHRHAVTGCSACAHQSRSLTEPAATARLRVDDRMCPGASRAPERALLAADSRLTCARPTRGRALPTSPPSAPAPLLPAPLAGEDDHYMHHYGTTVYHRDLPEAHKARIAEFKKYKGSVFRGLSILELSIFLLAGDFQKLAEHYVDYSQSMDKAQIASMLERRTKAKEMSYDQYEGMLASGELYKLHSVVEK
jgi:hypothetical protein